MTPLGDRECPDPVPFAKGLGSTFGEMSEPTPQSPPTSKFSLHKLSRKVLRRLGRRDRVWEKVADAVSTLRELDQGAPYTPDAAGPDFEEHSRILEATTNFGRPPEGMTSRGAFTELQGTQDYTGSPAALAPLDIESLSIPPAGFKPASWPALVGEKAPDLVKRFTSDILLPNSEQQKRLEEAGNIRLGTCTDDGFYRPVFGSETILEIIKKNTKI